MAKKKVAAAAVQALVSHGVDCIIPFNELVLSPKNVRKAKSDPDVLEQLAANIHQLGLVHRLSVIPGANGKTEVVAGGRRYAALALLVERGQLDPSQGIECKQYPDEKAVQISMAENTGREGMHPADQFEAFRVMLDDEGATLDDVAARYGVSTLTVRRRLKLAGIAPALLDLFREGEISQECLQVLALLDDHESQLHIWNNADQWHRRNAYHLKSLIAQEEISMGDGVVQFVGLDAYTAAGGEIRQDLFSEDGAGGFCKDAGLVRRLATERLAEQAEVMRQAGGWAWAAVRLNYRSYDGTMDEQYPVSRPATEDEQERLDAIEDEVAALTEQLHDMEDEDEATATSQKITQLESEAEAIENSRSSYTDEQKAVGGLVLALDCNGNVQVHEGLTVRASAKVASSEAVIGDVVVQPKKRADFSERLMNDLTAHRTAALQASLIDNPKVAKVALLHSLCHGLCTQFYQSPVQVRLTRPYEVKSVATGYEESRAGQRIEQAEAEWRALIPFGDGLDYEQLFDWLYAQDDALLDRLLAFCMSTSFNAMSGANGIGRKRDLTDKIAEALNLDMADWWQAGSANYFTHVGKPQIAAAVAAVKGAEVSGTVAGMKKGEAAAAAEQLLTGARWLPSPLVTVSAVTEASESD